MAIGATSPERVVTVLALAVGCVYLAIALGTVAEYLKGDES